MDVAERWRADLAAWAIPEPIMNAAGRSPWTLPRQVFVRRAERQIAAPEGPSFERAVEALRPRGDVLDVGTGAGAASLPLTPWAGTVTAVDVEDGMLETFAGLARDRGVPMRLVPGRWPDVADRVDPADVVVCHHVFYNVPDLGPFAAALTTHARRRVVVELTPRHPMTLLNPLWRRLHGIDRPDRPTADDAVAVLRGLGLEPRVERWNRPVQPEFGSFAEMVETTARRLCLPPDRHPDVAGALRDLGVDPDDAVYLGPPTRDLVTLWWDGTATSSGDLVGGVDEVRRDRGATLPP
jgi:SAM-dependent methyltransferase